MGHKTVFDCSVIDLGKVHFDAGNLTVVENDSTFPFDVKRVFYLFDIAGGESRGAHAHKECHQFLIAASGSFEVALDDGKFKRQVYLNRPDLGLHIPPGIWASEVNFSSGAICLVLASHTYTEADYIRNYDEFLKYRMVPDIQLVSYDKHFLEKSWNWLNDPEVKYLTNTGDFTREQQQKWFQSLPTLQNYRLWGVMIGHEPAGVFGLKKIENSSAEYWGYIGEKKFWGNGYGKLIMNLILDEARHLGLTMLWLRVIKANPRAIKLYEKLGFSIIEDGEDFYIMQKNL
ncbi:GNAT family N-acetyltransferase [Cloacibacterium normanense]|uniref:GNAT family N-acetyltransferase n=1 Tax=Cloacibacterium normanense TaxID=237258 RepID=UPI0035B15B73